VKRAIGGFWLLAALAAAGEVHRLTLREAVARALEQNPEVVLARLAEQAAEQRVEMARDPFIPKLYAGSGAAYTSGFPMSIEGSAPTVVQTRAVAAVFNRRLSHELAGAREAVRGARLDTSARREQAVLRTAELYLEAERLARAVELTGLQVESLERIADTVRARVAEGRELPVELRRAELDVTRARQRAQTYMAELAHAESLLASWLGFPAGDRVRPASEENRSPKLPESAEAAVAAALGSSLEVQRLEAELTARGYRVKAERAARLPSLSLVAQYGVFARFNNYDEFFRKFQRHNGQIGVAFEIPVFTGPAAAARASEAELEMERLRTELAAARRRIVVETQHRFEQVRLAETAAEVARQDLELARERVNIALARFEQGRALLSDVEQARYLENEKWLAFYEARYALEAARFRLLEKTGELLAQLR
jgi:outer membrane protein TolC